MRLLKLVTTFVIITIIPALLSGCGQKPRHRQDDAAQAAAPPAPPRHPDPPLTLYPGGKGDKPLSLYPANPATSATRQPDPPPPTPTNCGHSPPTTAPAVISAELQDMMATTRATRLRVDHAIEATESLAELVQDIEAVYDLQTKFASIPALSRASRGRLWLQWRELCNIEEVVGPLQHARRECTLLLADARRGHVTWPESRRALVSGHFDGLADDAIRDLPKRYRQLDRLAERIDLKLPDWTIKPVKPVRRRPSSLDTVPSTTED